MKITLGVLFAGVFLMCFVSGCDTETPDGVMVTVPSNEDYRLVVVPSAEQEVSDQSNATPTSDTSYLEAAILQGRSSNVSADRHLAIFIFNDCLYNKDYVVNPSYLDTYPESYTEGARKNFADIHKKMTVVILGDSARIIVGQDLTSEQKAMASVVRDCFKVKDITALTVSSADVTSGYFDKLFSTLDVSVSTTSKRVDVRGILYDIQVMGGEYKGSSWQNTAQLSLDGRYPTTVQEGREYILRGLRPSRAISFIVSKVIFDSNHKILGVELSNVANAGD